VHDDAPRMGQDQPLDALVREWLWARQVVRVETPTTASWEAAVVRAEAAGAACLARVIDLEAEVVPPGHISTDDRPISVLIAEAVAEFSPDRSLGSVRGRSPTNSAPRGRR
jgi:hypothetical protein